MHRVLLERAFNGELVEAGDDTAAETAAEIIERSRAAAEEQRETNGARTNGAWARVHNERKHRPPLLLSTTRPRSWRPSNKRVGRYHHTSYFG